MQCKCHSDNDICFVRRYTEIGNDPAKSVFSDEAH